MSLASPRRLVLLALAAVAAIAWPLLTYAGTLAAFGLAHVLCELRYLDARFGDRVGPMLRRTLLVGCLAIAIGRIVRKLELVPAAHATTIELGIAVVLVAAVFPVLARAGRMRAFLGVAAAAALAVGILVAPVHALLVVAVLHNLTPMGLLADASAGPARRRTLAIAAIVFVAVPIVIATGLPWTLLAALGCVEPELGRSVFGPIDPHMRAYLPESWLLRDGVLHAFAACVYLQCAHYVAVIDVLPGTLPGPRPGGRRFAAIVVGLGAIAGLGFLVDFGDTRGWYGVVAAVHAWIELPLLLLAAAVPPRR